MKSFFICMILLPIIVFSQTEFKSDSLNMEDTFGLSFSLKGLNLEKFEGGIGGKYWFLNDYAAYLSFNFSHHESEHGRSNSDQFSGGFSAGLEKHFFVNKIVSPFIGIGIRYEGTWGESKEKDYNDLSSLKIRNEIKRNILSSGIFGGVEIFVLKFISLSAHYGVWVVYYEFDDKRYYNDGRTSTEYYSKSISLDTKISSLSVSIYFN